MGGVHDCVAGGEGEGVDEVGFLVEDDGFGGHVAVDYAEGGGGGGPTDVVDGAVFVCLGALGLACNVWSGVTYQAVSSSRCRH